jgi:hypothetical protein
MKLFRSEEARAKSTTVMIISATRIGEETDTRDCIAFIDKLYSLGVKFSVGEGSYLGNITPSFVIIPDGCFNEIMHYAFEILGQECVLTRDITGVYLESIFDRILIGTELVVVPEEEASTQEGYTYVNGRYYIVK